MANNMMRRQIGFDPTVEIEEICALEPQVDAEVHEGPDDHLRELLLFAAARNASDVHLVPGQPPALRIHGHLELTDLPTLTSDEIGRMAASILPPPIFDDFEQLKNADCSVWFSEDGQRLRFRANVYLARDGWCICLRHIPNEIPSLEWLGFPAELAERLVSNQNGLVIITGEVGAGKSSTLAALINLLRSRRRAHILTIEEPIEYIFEPDGRSLITQREVGRDVDSFADGLKYGLRQDPDVIMVGEIRDRETAQMALSAAETGHLILTTLHTRDAKGALTRLVDLFPHEAQDDVRAQLALSLRSVVSQKLLPSGREGDRRVLVLEVLHASPAVQATIRSGRIETLESALQMGLRDGMILLDDELRRLLREGRISIETARAYAKDPSAFNATNRRW